jgi:phage-related protein
VRDCLQQQSSEDRRAIGQDLARAQWRWPVGSQARVIICHHDGELWALHAFEKKTRNTPKGALDLAAKRLKSVINP